MNRTAFLANALALQIMASTCLADAPQQKVDHIIEQYTPAVGGNAAIDRIETREVDARQHRGPKLTYFWQKPDKILLEKQKQRIGYDGSSGWMLSQKKRVTRLPKGAQRPLEQDADPLRYVRLKALYSELDPAPAVTIDGRKMDVLVAPNERGATKFYFDAETHLLARIDDTGETSAYYKRSTEFSDYRAIDGIKFPYRIVHSSTEPGVGDQDIRISKVTQNVELKASLFDKPAGGAVTFGGKR
jgi:hypothetical protein